MYVWVGCVCAYVGSHIIHGTHAMAKNSINKMLSSFLFRFENSTL